jgi:hypothetical protein
MSRFDVKESAHLWREDGRTQGESTLRRGRANNSVYDLRVYRLFVIIRQLEECADRLSESEFNDLLDDAILASGFANEVEALRATLNVFGDGLCLADLQAVTKPS